MYSSVPSMTSRFSSSFATVTPSMRSFPVNLLYGGRQGQRYLIIFQTLYDISSQSSRTAHHFVDTLDFDSSKVILLAIISPISPEPKITASFPGR